MEYLKQKLIWLLPLAIFIGLFTLLFFQGAKTVSQKPSDEWSRGIEVGKTNSKTFPTLHQTEDGQYTISLFNEGTLTKKVFSSDFSLEEESTTEVSFTKWDPYYVNDNQLIYYQDNEIHTQDGQSIAKAEEMFVVDDQIFYLQDNTFYSLHPTSLESNPLGSIPEGYETYDIIFQDEQPTIIGYGTTGNLLNYGIYQAGNDKLEEIHAQTHSITLDERIVEVDFAATNDQFAIVLKSLVEQSGRNPYRLYVSEFKASDDTLTFRNIDPLDPKTGQRIDEIGELAATYFNEQLNITFNGVGFSMVDYKTKYLFNIYEVNVIDEEKITAKRRSNTFKFSTKSKLIQEDMIMWLDKETPNTLYISSSKPEFVEQANRYKSIDMMLALGFAMEMMAKAFLFLPLTFKWWIGPLGFFVLLLLFHRKSIDHNYNWVFYAAIGVYLLGAFVQKGVLFTQTLQATAPFYIAFPGSSFIIILLAALIAYACMQTIHRSTGAGYKVVYFVFIHLLVLSLMAGPYVW